MQPNVGTGVADIPISDERLQLIGSIYDAVGDDNAVAHVMADISAHLGATVAFWYVVRRGASGDAVRSPFLFAGAFGCSAATLGEFSDEMWRYDYALRAASVTDRTTETHELISPAELAVSDYAQWIAKSAGVDRRIGRSTDLGDQVVAGWAFHMPVGLRRRSRERDEFELLAPHVRNLLRLTSQFGELNAQHRGFEQAINDQEHAVVLLAVNGTVQWASDPAMRICSRNDGLALIAGKLTFQRSKEKRSFDALLQNAQHFASSNVATPAQMVVERVNGAFPYVLEIAPAPLQLRRHVHSQGTFLVTIHDPDRCVDARPHLWRKMFNLTPAESRVAALTMRGLSDDSISMQLGVSVGTVRTHQKQLLAKTGTRSKAEAAHLLTRMT